MRTIELIQIENKDMNFTELYHLDGPKLEVCNDEKAILVWYDEHDSFENWLYIKSSADQYMDYISNKIPLLDIIKENSTYYVERYYQSYDKINIVEKITNIDNYKYMPTNKSFLNFNYAVEIRFDNLFKMKNSSLYEYTIEKNNQEVAKIKNNSRSSLFDHIGETTHLFESKLSPVNDTTYRKEKEYARS